MILNLNNKIFCVKITHDGRFFIRNTVIHGLFSIFWYYVRLLISSSTSTRTWGTGACCLPTRWELSEEQRHHPQYIERIVPLYPLSRDRYRYENLIKVLSLYRMTLGQPRQEELLQLLKDMPLSYDQLHELTIDLCPFNKIK